MVKKVKHAADFMVYPQKLDDLYHDTSTIIKIETHLRKPLRNHLEGA